MTHLLQGKPQLIRSKCAFACLVLVLVCVNPIVSAKSEVEVLPNCVLRLAAVTSASRETVWSLWADVENWKAFDTLLDYSRLDKGQSFMTGARGVVKAKGSPKTRFILTNVEPGVSFIETLQLPLGQKIDLVRYFEASEDNRTVFVHEVRFRGRLKQIAYWVAAGTFKKELPLVMGRLRDLAESEPSATGVELKE